MAKKGEGKFAEIIEMVDRENFPNWAEKAFSQGNFFRIAVGKVEKLETIIKQMVELSKSTSGSVLKNAMEKLKAEAEIE